MSLEKKEIGELLVDNGLLSTEQLDLVEQEKRRTGQSIRQIVTRLGLISENQLKDTLELQYGVTYVALNRIKIEPKTINLLADHLIREYKVLPISQQDDVLNLAMVNPDDSKALDAVKSELPTTQIRPMVCMEDDYERFVDFFFPNTQVTVKAAVLEPDGEV